MRRGLKITTYRIIYAHSFNICSQAFGRIPNGSEFTVLPFIKGTKSLAWFVIIEGVLLIVMGVFTRNLVPSVVLLIGGATVLWVLRKLRKRLIFNLR